MVALHNIMHHNKKLQEMTICCLDKGVLPFPRGSYICVMETHKGSAKGVWPQQEGSTYAFREQNFSDRRKWVVPKPDLNQRIGHLQHILLGGPSLGEPGLLGSVMMQLAECTINCVFHGVKGLGIMWSASGMAKLPQREAGKSVESAIEALYILETFIQRRQVFSS